MPMGRCNECGFTRALNDDILCFTCEKDAMLADLRARYKELEPKWFEAVRQRDIEHLKAVESERWLADEQSAHAATRTELTRAREWQATALRLMQRYGDIPLDVLRYADWTDWRAFLAAPPQADISPAGARQQDILRQQAVERVIATLRQLALNWSPITDGDHDITTVLCDTADFDALCDAMDALADLRRAGCIDDGR